MPSLCLIERKSDLRRRPGAFVLDRLCHKLVQGNIAFPCADHCGAVKLRGNPDVELAFIFLVGGFAEFFTHRQVVVDALMKHLLQLVDGASVKAERVIDPDHFTDKQPVLIGVADISVIASVFHYLFSSSYSPISLMKARVIWRARSG